MFDPAAMPVAKKLLGNRVTFASKSYAALSGADALAVITEWNEFREPDFGEDAQAAEEPGHLRRAQHLQPRRDEGERLHLLLHWALTARSSSRAAPATSAATSPKPSPGPGGRVVVYDDLSAGHRGAVRWCDLVVGDVHDEARLTETMRRYGVTAVMHFAAWLSVGDSVRDPSGYYRNNVEGTLAVLRAMLAVLGAAVRVLVDGRRRTAIPEETPITEGHPTRPINAYGETKLAVERALAHFEGRVRPAQRRAAVLQRRRARIRTANSARITARSTT